MMDDGSDSAERSLEMLRLLRSQGVSRVVATPHFYPKKEDPDSFLKRRRDCAAMLRSAIEFSGMDKSLIPEVCIGAEVAYYNGMSLTNRIRELCIEGTNVMLLEMPFCKWSDSVVSEVCKMQRELGLQIVLAHVDRYMQYVDSAKLFKLKSYRVLMQVNADPFLRFFSGHKMLKLLQTGTANVLGSDFHNLEERSSHMDEAMQTIIDRGYGERLEKMMAHADELLKQAVPLVP